MMQFSEMFITGILTKPINLLLYIDVNSIVPSWLYILLCKYVNKNSDKYMHNLHQNFHKFSVILAKLLKIKIL